MADFDGKAFGASIVTTVKGYVAKTIAPLTDRLAALEARLDAIPVAKDGVGLAGALIDRGGNLVLTLSDGTTREIGLVIGKDGTNGSDGAAGRDGFGFDDMTEELADDGRTIVRRYTRGDAVKEFRHSIAVVLDRGVYKAGQDYAPGDGVTFGGSFWIAQEKTAAKPDGGSGWRLAVKRGRDVKDAKTRGDCQEFCAGGRLSSDDEPLAEDDGELAFGLTPFAWRAFPFVRGVIEHEV